MLTYTPSMLAFLIDDYFVLMSHLPGNEILKFLYLLEVLWVLQHVLVIEECLCEKRHWSQCFMNGGKAGVSTGEGRVCNA